MGLTANVVASTSSGGSGGGAAASAPNPPSIVKYASNTSSSSVLYTVPTGKVLIARILFPNYGWNMDDVYVVGSGNNGNGGCCVVAVAGTEFSPGYGHGSWKYINGWELDEPTTREEQYLIYGQHMKSMT